MIGGSRGARYRFFSSIVGVKADGLCLDYQEKTAAVKTQLKFRPVDEGEVLNILKWLDPNKACRVDRISAKLLRMVAPGICRSLAHLFNASIKSRKVPEEWKSVHVKSVPKSGDSDAVTNFRPISVLPVVVKVFERLIHQQLYRYIPFYIRHSLVLGLVAPLRAFWSALLRNGERQWTRAM